MNTHYAVKCHDWVRSKDKVLRVALLALVWIKEHILLVKRQLSLLSDMLRLHVCTEFIFEEVDILLADLKATNLLS